MTHEYERDRITGYMTQLKREYDQLTHSIMRTKRDEQFEVERLRHDFKVRITGMETRQQDITREIENKRKELERLEQRIRAAKGSQASAIQDEKERRLDRIR